MLPAFTSSTVIVGTSNAPQGILYIIRDLTEIKQAEEQRMQLERKMYQTGKMETIGLMVGGVAHDLNNILSGIINYPEILLLDLPEDSPLRRPVKAIHNSGLRAAAVVADLLTVARGATAAKEVCDLKELLPKYLQTPELQRSLEVQPGITLCTDFAPDLFNINCSPIHIRKCVLNLVINGCEAIDKTGTVTISARNCSLEEPLRGYVEIPCGEYIILSVKDTGSGISSEDIDHIFEPFYSRKVMGRSGTGLGLAVVWNVVQDHDGYIDVTTNSQGTCFDLYFPKNNEPTIDAPEEITSRDLRGNGQSILIVDDEAAQRDIATSLLTRLGYQPTSVVSGEEAVSFLGTRRVDLVVLDMVMGPGMNGRTTYEQIILLHPGQKAIITSDFLKAMK